MFQRKPLHLLLSVTLFAVAGAAQAASTQFDNFTPMTGNVVAGSLPESAPFVLSSPNFTQVAIANKLNQDALGQANTGVWDMITANETGPDAGRYLFMPFEPSTGAGVQRIDLQDTNYNTRTVTIIQPGTDGFSRGDASRWAPWGGYLTAEESWSTGGNGKGRLFEVTNPLADTTSANFIQRSVVPRVAHEGLAFDNNNNLYFVDELDTGGIYKYASNDPNASNGDDYFASGQTFVLKVGAGSNAGATGASTWVAITDINGVALPGVNTLSDGTVDGRQAQDAIASTSFNRPEDLEIKTLEDGTQILFVATTGTDNVMSLNLGDGEMKEFVDVNTIDAATGVAAGIEFNDPDNMAIDAEGNIYIVEDQTDGFANIWFALDANNDGVAESISKWATLSTLGAEPTGLYFDKFNPNIAYVNVQHPTSGNDYTIQITAVPEAETYAMMLAGLGLIGFAASRRNSKK